VMPKAALSAPKPPRAVLQPQPRRTIGVRLEMSNDLGKRPSEDFPLEVRMLGAGFELSSAPL
jgi:hypothetical protein